MCRADVALLIFLPIIMKISVLINSKDRPQVLARCLDSVLSQVYTSFEVRVLDDGSTGCRLVDELAPQFSDERLYFTRVAESLGVARGRNLLMQQASGDIFVIIDDDAVFADNQALRQLAGVFAAQPDVGIVACKIIDHRDDQEHLLIPLSQRARRKYPSIVNRPGRVSYFLGGGHALRRDVLTRCGPYSNQLTFGEEELDLSYRAIETGFEIFYLPDVIIHHYPQPSVLQSSARQRPELYYHVQNRFFLARKYLPWRYVPVYLTIWLARYGGRAVKTGEFSAFGAAVLAGLIATKTVNRTPLGSQTVAYLRTNHGRLWY